MKQTIKNVSMLLLLLAGFSCAATRPAAGPAEPVLSTGGLFLDAAIDQGAAYFLERLPPNTTVAIIPFEAPSGRLADYVFEEIWNRFEDSGGFIMVDRRNLARIDAEIAYQLGSGLVDDELAVSITKQYGAQILVHGRVTTLGGEYRMTVYATDVETAVSNQRAYTIRPDQRLSGLLETTLDDEVARAVSRMADAVSRKTTIAVGRISYAGTETVSGLSAWLKDRIIYNAQQQPSKFEIASETETSQFALVTRGLTVVVPEGTASIQAVITGTYSPLDSGAEVLLHLTSTGGTVLASARFSVTKAELERRKLSLLPDKGSGSITLPEFEAKQAAIAPYMGSLNRWNFIVSPDVLDGIYRDGDLMSMQLYSERDCYFRIIHVDVNGNTKVIYPAAEIDNNFIRAGETRRIPDNFMYRMEPPFGEELILVAAYDRRFNFNSPSPVFPLNADSIKRSLTVGSAGASEISPVATARFSYTVLPRS